MTRLCRWLGRLPYRLASCIAGRTVDLSDVLRVRIEQADDAEAYAVPVDEARRVNAQFARIVGSDLAELRRLDQRLTSLYLRPGGDR